MGITRSLVTGASAMKAQQDMFDVLSDNIANVNTTGFKSSRATFADQFSQIYRYGKSPSTNLGTGEGGLNPMQFGLGVKIGAITKDMSQGIIESTNRPLDLALQGDGFFIVNQNNREYYTRAGAFSRDLNGFLVDSATGAYVQGYNLNFDSNGRIVKDSNGGNILNSKVDDLRIPPDILSAPRQTQQINISGNLSAQNDTGFERTTSINIYDYHGNVHSITLNFTKTENENEYSVTAEIDNVPVTLNQTTIQFNNDGTLNTPMTAVINASDLNTAIGSNAFDATGNKNITINFGDPNNLISGSITNFGGANSATFKTQDGYASGDLLSLNVDQEGQIWGSFTNGQSEILGQIVIAKFTNPEGLLKEGMNYYSVAPNSGLPIVGTAVSSFQSTKITSNALEQSNVDLVTEFTNMITTQRAYEAASRVILTSDQMIQQLGVIKR